MKNLSTKEINLLRHNARDVVRELGLLNDAYFEIGVTLAERHLLIELSTCTTGPTMGEIAERLLVDKSTVSRLIEKAIKKGYVRCVLDEKDKRKRFLYLTELGLKTLKTFEPIAFKQTKKALLTLSTEEIDLVHQGVYLYAKGLKNSRLQNKEIVSSKKQDEKSNPKNSSKNLLEIHRQLSERGFTLRPFCEKDEHCLYGIFREVVDSGTQFPYESNSVQEFYRQFFTTASHVYVCHCSNNELIGGFYLRPNFSGRSDHIANAAFMIKSSYRGRGIGTLLINASLKIAKDLGFLAMQFNMVLSQNITAIKLYQKLGFNIIGTLPEAVRNSDGSYQDGHIFYRKLTD